MIAHLSYFHTNFCPKPIIWDLTGWWVLRHAKAWQCNIE